jgi:hypothetical protein
MLIDFALSYGQMNMKSNFVHMMMWNTFAPKCDKKWVQMCIHQLQLNPTICVGTSLGLSLGGCQKMDLDF